MGQIKPTRVDHNISRKAEAILEGGMQEFWHTLCCNKYGSSRDRRRYRKQRFTAIFKIKRLVYGADPTLG